MIYFLLITSFIVSIDSFACGFSLSVNTKKSAYVVSIIAVTVLIMCLFTNYLPKIFIGINDKIASVIGGCLLIIIGLINLFKKDNAEYSVSQSVKQCFLTGVAVGIDGSLANLSLALMGINYFYVPFVIALMHAIMVSLGIALSNTKLIRKINFLNILAPLLLIILGIYKILF